MVGEDTFYESASVRDERFNKLVEAVTQSDPEWMQRFIPYLRNTAQMRSASIVMAAEYVRAGGPNGRQVVNSAISRADEPMELVGYWLSKYGRQIPMAIKRGVSDALKRVATEYNVLKYDGQSKAVRMGDLVNLFHPKADDDKQARLFKHLLDRRYGNFSSFSPEEAVLFPKLVEAYRLDKLNAEQLRSELDAKGPQLLSDAGYTWERLSSTLKMDAAAWEAIIPSMGYMALLRNLRNFDQAGISPEVRKFVASKLADPEEVAKSRQFPFRFMSAYTQVESEHWKPVLEEALNLSVKNITGFEGSTLILVDTSGSMGAPLSARSKVTRAAVGAVFGAALAVRSPGDVTLAAWADRAEKVPYTGGASVLGVANKIMATNVGWGTELWPSIRQTYSGQDRIVIFSDMQIFPDGVRGGYGGYGMTKESDLDQFKHVPQMHAFNLAGYGTAVVPSAHGRWEYGGFTDATFRLMPILESSGKASWPF
jgi:hypothetical protein